MRLLTAILFFLLFYSSNSFAQWTRPRKQHWPKTEGELMHKLLRTLQNKDTVAYSSLFPPFDTLWHMVMHNPDKSPEVVKELNHLKEHPQALIEFDPRYNYSIINSYSRVLAKGNDSGLFWNGVVMARYHLVKQEPTRALIGYERIAPERFRGYMFVTDPSNRLTFCISVAEIHKIKGQFFGGQVINVLEASSIEDFHRKEESERKYMEWLELHPDSAAAIAKADTTAVSDTNAVKSKAEETSDEDEDRSRVEVVDRKYYEGLLDNEIKIRLYIRYMRIVPGKPQQYDGLYKLGENKRYMRLDIATRPDGKWIFDDELGVGNMELVLNGKTYTGVWMNADDNGYDVKLNITSAPKGKIELLDKILDRGISGRVDEGQFEDDKSDKQKREKRVGRNRKKKDDSDSKDDQADDKKKENVNNDKSNSNADKKKNGEKNDDDKQEKEDGKQKNDDKTNEK